ncbi:MAG TPA: glycosyltransferase family 39 protein [Candidatus Binataceae bacterium]|nr:glycosyltransferase family 39 protein [Candidatus Binataceae bacterium]
MTTATDRADFSSPHWLEYLEPLAPRMSATGLARLASAMVGASLLAVALVVGIGLRTVALDRVPAGFNQDEACNGYDAYSLLRTGRDQHGNLLPVAIQAFNDYRMPLFDYSLVVPVGLFGLRPVSVRLGAALWGIADLVAVATIASMLVGLRGAAVAVALLAISPWHLPISRFGHEAITASATTSLAAAAFFLAIRLRRARWLAVSAVMFGLSLYSYSITKAFVLPFILWIAAFHWRELSRFRKQALAGLIVIVICAIPQAWALWRNYPQMMARYHSVSILGLPVGLRLRLFGQGLLFNFSPHFLFQNGSSDISLHPPGYGQLLVAQAAMLFLALCALMDAKFRRVAMFLFGWLAIAAVTAVLILPFGHPLHTLLMLTPLTLLCALGMVFLFDLAAANRLARLLVAAAIVTAMLVQGAKFLNFYFRDYPGLAAYDFQYGLGPTVAHAAALGSGPLVITHNINQPYIYVLFFTKYPPQRFQHERVVQDRGLFAPVLGFDRYRFADPQMAYFKLDHGIFVFTGWEPAPRDPVYLIRFPLGHVAFQVVVK